MGNQVLLDPTYQEIVCCDAVFAVSIDKKNSVSSLSILKHSIFGDKILEQIFQVRISFIGDHILGV